MNFGTPEDEYIKCKYYKDLNQVQNWHGVYQNWSLISLCQFNKIRLMFASDYKDPFKKIFHQQRKIWNYFTCSKMFFRYTFKFFPYSLKWFRKCVNLFSHGHNAKCLQLKKPKTVSFFFSRIFSRIWNIENRN